MTKQDYIASIRKAGFGDATILEEHEYMSGNAIGGRKISSIVVRAVKS